MAIKGSTLSQEQKKKISKTRTGQTHSEETKQKISDGLKGNKNSKGKKFTFTEEHKKHISEACIGRTISEERKREIGNFFRGKKLTEEHKKKLSVGKQGANNPFFGKPLSKEHKEKVSKGRKEFLRNNPEFCFLKFRNIHKPSRPQIELYEQIIPFFSDAMLEYSIPNTTRFADIGIPSLKLDVEYDGKYWHQNEEEDKKRDKEIEDVGWTIVRIKEGEDYKNAACNIRDFWIAQGGYGPLSENRLEVHHG